MLHRNEKKWRKSINQHGKKNEKRKKKKKKKNRVASKQSMAYQKKNGKRGGVNEKENGEKYRGGARTSWHHSVGIVIARRISKAYQNARVIIRAAILTLVFHVAGLWYYQRWPSVPKTSGCYQRLYAANALLLSSYRAAWRRLSSIFGETSPHLASVAASRRRGNHAVAWRVWRDVDATSANMAQKSVNRHQ